MMIETNSPEETYAFGKKLGMEAQAGQVYCLNGDLGVGKTVFTQGFAAGLGIQEPVNSPTFTIVQEYDDGRLPLYHFDVYRLGDVDEMDEIGYEDYFYEISWDKLVKVKKIAGIYVLYLGRDKAYLMPKRVFRGSEEQIFLSMLTRNLPQEKRRGIRA